MSDIFENVFAYDSEIYPNVFTIEFVKMTTGEKWVFEISDRVNNGWELYQFLMWLSQNGIHTLGYNNEGFDYPILHHFMTLVQAGVWPTAADMYEKSSAIIATDWNDRFMHMIWENDRFIKQIDVFKVMHFDNEARSTSLKMLEIRMRSKNVVDLPFPPGTWLTFDQIDTLRHYQSHDVCGDDQIRKAENCCRCVGNATRACRNPWAFLSELERHQNRQKVFRARA